MFGLAGATVFGASMLAAWGYLRGKQKKEDDDEEEETSGIAQA